VYLARGIEDAGRGLGQAIREYRSRKDESAFLNEQVEGLAAVAAPLVKSEDLDPKLVEEVAKFPELSLNQKRGKAASLAFAIKSAQDAKLHRERKEISLAGLELDRGRMLLAAREDERRQQERTGLAGFNARLAEVMQAPETIRAPLDQVLPRLAAESGIATPDMLGRLVGQDLEGRRLDISERAVGVQERQAGIGERKLDQGEDDNPSLEGVERMINAVTLTMADPVNAQAAPLLQERLQELIQLRGSIGGVAAPAEGSAKGGGADVELQAALDAIRRGAPRDQVAKRYRERTGKSLPNQ
jgi:hypothetical protein